MKTKIDKSNPEKTELNKAIKIAHSEWNEQITRLRQS
jgi:hypothetical protein